MVHRFNVEKAAKILEFGVFCTCAKHRKTRYRKNREVRKIHNRMTEQNKWVKKDFPEQMHAYKTSCTFIYGSVCSKDSKTKRNKTKTGSAG